MNRETIEEIKNTDFLKRVFSFKSNDEKDFSVMFKSKREMKKYEHIKWLYLSDNKYAKLIGVMEEGFVFKIDEDFDKDIFSFSFFNIPFDFFRLSAIESGKSEVDYLAKNDLYRSDLGKYIAWCNENGYNIEKRNLTLLQDSINILNTK